MKTIKSIGITTAGTLIGQVFILVYRMLFAKYFGTTGYADVFILAFSIILVISNEMIGIINAVFIPVYTKHREKEGMEKAGKIFNISTGNLLIFLIVITIIIFLFSPLIVNLSGSNFPEEKKHLTVFIMRAFSVLLIMFPLTTLFANLLTTFRLFVVPAFNKAIVHSVVIIFMFFLLVKSGINSIIMGMLAGIMLFFIFEIFELKGKVKIKPEIKFNALKEMYVLAVPLLFASLANQANIFVEKSIAGSLQEGTISSLDYAVQLTIFPVTLGVTSIMTVLFPSMSEQINRNEFNKVKKLMYKGLFAVLSLFTLYTVFLLLFSEPFVRIIYERGLFTKASTLMTAKALSLYAPGVIGLSGIMVLSKIYHALKDMKTLTIVGIISIVLNIFLMLTLTAYKGYIGIPICFSIVSSLHFIVLFIILSHKISRI